MERSGPPAVPVDAAAAEHFEVLDLVVAGLVRMVEGVDHTCAFKRYLFDSVHHLRKLDPGQLKNRGCDVDNMMKLGAEFAGSLDMTWPGNDQGIARAAEMRGHFLGPLERCVARPSPGGGVMVGKQLAAQVVQMFQPFLDGTSLVVHRHAVVALKTALRAAAVIAHDIKDRGVFHMAFRADGLEQASHLVIGLRQKAGVDFHLMGQQFLLRLGERIPGGDLFGPRRQLRIGGYCADLPFAGKGLLAQLVPTLIEEALLLGDPLLRHVMWGVRGAGGQVKEERLLRGYGIMLLDPVDRVVHQVRRQVVDSLVPGGRFHGCRVAIQCGLPLADRRAQKTVEVFEAQSGGPVIERPGRVHFPYRCVVPLAERRGAVAVELQNLRHGGGAPGPDGVVAGIPGSGFGDHAEADFVIVAPGEQRTARGRAHGVHVETVVAQSARSQLAKKRRRHRTAKRRGGAEADIVQQDQDHIGCAFASSGALRPIRCGFVAAGIDFALESGVGFGQRVRRPQAGGHRQQPTCHDQGPIGLGHRISTLTASILPLNGNGLA